MKQIHVLHLYRTYFPETQGGVQEAVRQLSFATQNMQVKNTVFALAKVPIPPTLKLLEADVVRAKSWLEIASCDIGGIDAFVKCRALAQKADIIQVHYPWPFADVLLPFIRQKRQPLVVTYHSDVVRQGMLDRIYAPLRNYLLRSATAIVATSPNYAQTSSVLQKHAPKVSCIPLCLGADHLADQTIQSSLRDQHGSGFFLFVGVLRYYKGLNFLLNAAKHVEAKILIVGDGPEGSLLRTLAKQLNLRNVHFLGSVADAEKFALINLCRAVVFPSCLRSEAFGMTLLEGARAGKPLISCELGSGTTWVNRHMETGLVVPPGNSGALAEAMNKLHEDEILSTNLGRGAQARWRQLFTPSVVGASYRQLYERVLSI